MSASAATMTMTWAAAVAAVIRSGGDAVAEDGAMKMGVKTAKKTTTRAVTATRESAAAAVVKAHGEEGDTALAAD